MRTKLRVAIGSFENLPIPLMLLMVPCGDVAGLPSENSSPSSVPASYGYRLTECCVRHCPPPSRDSRETPTNQSGLGPIIETRVSMGWSLVTRRWAGFRLLRKLGMLSQGERESGRAGVLDAMSDNRGSSTPKNLRRVQRGENTERLRSKR